MLRIFIRNTAGYKREAAAIFSASEAGKQIFCSRSAAEKRDISVQPAVPLTAQLWQLTGLDA